MKVNKSLITLGAVALAAAALSSCSDKSEADETTIAFRTIKGQAVYRLDNTSKIFDTDHDIVYFDSASIVMPTVIYNQDITALQDSIISAAFDTVSPYHLDAMNSYFRKVVDESGYTAVEVNDSVARSERDGLTIVQGDIFNMSADMLTYRVMTYSYSPGAAHGMSITKYITYLINEGKLVSLADMFTPEGLKQLPGLLRARAEELAPSLGPTDITALPSMDNFYVSLDDNIVFVYQPYEVASYAQGAIAVPFYPYQLADQMTAEGLRMFGLGE